MKKRILALLVVISIILCFTGCSGTKIQSLQLGETAKTNKIEFKLSETYISKVLDNVISDNFMKPNENNNLPKNPYRAEEGKTMVSFFATIKNVGKKEFQLRDFNVEIVYGDGYTYSECMDSFYVMHEGIYSDIYDYKTIQPLENQNICGCVEVPIAILENTEESLNVNIRHNNKIIATYIIR